MISRIIQTEVNVICRSEKWFYYTFKTKQSPKKLNIFPRLFARFLTVLYFYSKETGASYKQITHGGQLSFQTI
jgi:hypothetical protein